jgi:hypothetical protein
VNSTTAATNAFADVFDVHRKGPAAVRAPPRIAAINMALYGYADFRLRRRGLRTQISLRWIKWNAERLPAPPASNRFSENPWCRMENAIAMWASEYRHNILELAAI